ncbi:MAG: DNA-directed RNA polymerase subunit D [Candidatus Thermoplasmatota archaeon]|nr:DNA-directed RNA polymerase subunit D [Candidatus Thermoplasmatota archaeon]
MDIKILEMTDTSAKLVISGTQPPIMNALRRALLAEVPKMAIEDVEFHMGSIMDEEGNEYESGAPLFDEIIAHRLGLIPIPTDLSLFTMKDECKCGGEGCPNCTIMYSLNKRGPCTVYSGDLEPLGDKTLAIKDDLVPIVKLNKDQALLIYATAELGNGKRHSKWQACQAVGYKYYPKLEISEEAQKYADDILEVVPKGLLKKKDGKLVASENDPDTYEIIVNHAEAVLPGGIRMVGDPTKFIFKFETDGSITAKQAFTKALELLEQKFDDTREGISSLG